MKLVTVLYAKPGNKFLFNELPKFAKKPTDKDVVRDYQVVYQKFWGDSITAEKLYALFNTTDCIGQDIAKQVGHTSMSCGDIVCIDNKRMYCASTTFEEF